MHVDLQYCVYCCLFMSGRNSWIAPVVRGKHVMLAHDSMAKSTRVRKRMRVCMLAAVRIDR